jgi:hypothetical protein
VCPRLLAAFLVPLLIAGCIPLRFSGYLPSGPGTRESGYCIAGIKDVVRIDLHSGVEVILRASTNERKKTILLHAYMAIPEENTVRLTATQMVLDSEYWPSSRMAEITNIWSPVSGTVQPLTLLTGSPPDLSSYYPLGFNETPEANPRETGIAAVEAFYLRFPDLLINGERFSIPPIEFRRYRNKWGVPYCIQ